MPPFQISTSVCTLHPASLLFLSRVVPQLLDRGHNLLQDRLVRQRVLPLQARLLHRRFGLLPFLISVTVKRPGKVRVLESQQTAQLPRRGIRRVEQTRLIVVAKGGIGG